jgi:23S rRNA (cytidine1920-2'-O)/16S rRNA (cytidine1409-2'-O)-methyltransferase
MSRKNTSYASRGGDKLAAALDAFGVSVEGFLCADFGSAAGGFTDCLLRRGAARVYAVDAGYGQLEWGLRNDLRVVVQERTNALHIDPPEPVDLVTIDVAWTPQRRIVPAALRWLKPGGRVVSLLKPHYELWKLRGRKPPARLNDAEARSACREVLRRLAEDRRLVRAVAPGALRGKGGNMEFFLLLTAEELLAPAATLC